MESIDRRHFMKVVAATPMLGMADGVASVEGYDPGELESQQKLVKFYGDGLSLSPAEYIHVLQSIMEDKDIQADYYSRGGVVEELEVKMAAALGKERAIYFPTGTLANQIAVRNLAGNRSRVIVQNLSHIYNDSGDCLQQLSQLNLVPLAPETATFTLEDVKAVMERTDSGRVTTGIGVIVIESPVRRRLGELFDYEEMKNICSFAREQGVKTHLDGARIYMASAYTGISPKEYASHFDTIYVSLWKYFNAGAGAILAGSNEVIDQMYHTRRLFGGGLPEAWPYAAVVLHYLDGFEAELSRAVETAEAFFALLEKDSSFGIEKVPNGSNRVKVIVKGTNLQRFREKLKSKGILLPGPNEELGGFVVNVNPTLNRTNAATLADLFKESMPT